MKLAGVGFRVSLSAALIILVLGVLGRMTIGQNQGEPNPGQKLDDRTDAERIAGAMRLMANDRARQEKLNRELERLNSRFESLTEKFTQLDRRRVTGHLLPQAVPPAAPTPQPTSQQQGGSGAPPDPLLESEWTTARDNLNQLIRRRKLIQLQSSTLSEKLQLEHDYLQRLTQPVLSAATVEPVARPPARPAESLTAPTVPSAVPSPSLPGMPALPVVPPPPEANKGPADVSTETIASPSTSLGDVDERVVAARKDQEASKLALRAARDRLEFVDRSIDVFERDLKHSREMLADAQLQSQDITTDLNASATGNIPDAADAVYEAELREDLLRATDSIKEETAVIAETEAMLKRLHDSRDDAFRQVTAASRSLSNAQTWVLLLESPLSPSRLIHWLTDHGPKVVSVLILIAAMLGISRLIERRVLSRLLQRRGSPSENSGRAETLRRVFHSFSNFAILTLGSLAVLDQAGVNVTVLLGGAAVLGAAIAFGSQHLIRDFFSGFMILIENQYSVGHVVSVGTKSGQVEDITLRMTVLRDEEGIVHFIPHSQATVVSNMTYGWARAVFVVTVDYRENVDRVMKVLMDLARDMRHDPKYGMLMIDNPELQGVDRLGDSAVSIKFLVKTQPIQQWTIKRELLRRIKNRFDELGIAFAFPQRELHINSDQFEVPRTAKAVSQ